MRACRNENISDEAELHLNLKIFKDLKLYSLTPNIYYWKLRMMITSVLSRCVSLAFKDFGLE